MVSQSTLPCQGLGAPSPLNRVCCSYLSRPPTPAGLKWLAFLALHCNMNLYPLSKHACIISRKHRCATLGLQKGSSTMLFLLLFCFVLQNLASFAGCSGISVSDEETSVLYLQWYPWPWIYNYTFSKELKELDINPSLALWRQGRGYFLSILPVGKWGQIRLKNFYPGSQWQGSQNSGSFSNIPSIMYRQRKDFPASHIIFPFLFL